MVLAFRQINPMIVSILIILSSGIVIAVSPFNDQYFHDEYQEMSWGSFRGDWMNRGLGNSNLSDLELLWEYKADSSIGTTVIIKERTAIFGTSNGTVYSLDSELGRVNWKVNVGAPVFSTPAFDLELSVVYVCDNSGKVTCLDIEDGSTIWTWQSESQMQIQSSPLVIPGGNIYFGSDDSYLYSLYPNGTLAWRFEGCTGWIYTSPSLYLNMVYFGSCDGYMRAVSATNGSEIWNFSTQYIPSSPSIDTGKVYFGSYESKIFCLDALTGEMIWNTTMGDDIYSSPAVDVENVVVGCNDGFLYCLDKETGQIKWTMDLGPNDLETSPVISRGKVAITYQQGLVIVHLANGTIYERYLYGNSALVSPSVFHGKLLFGDEQGYVYCLSREYIVNEDDDDDNTLDLNDELSLRRDVVYFIIAFILILSAIIFIYLKKYKPLRGAP